MERKAARRRDNRKGSTTSVEPERLSSSSIPTAASAVPYLSESQIGGNYMLQMEGLLPEDAISSNDDASDKDESPRSTPPLGRESSQSFVQRLHAMGTAAGTHYRPLRSSRFTVNTPVGSPVSGAGTPTNASFSQSISPRNPSGSGRGSSSRPTMGRGPPNSSYDSRDLAQSARSVCASSGFTQDAAPCPVQPTSSSPPSSLSPPPPAAVSRSTTSTELAPGTAVPSNTPHAGSSAAATANVNPVNLLYPDAKSSSKDEGERSVGESSLAQPTTGQQSAAAASDEMADLPPPLTTACQRSEGSLLTAAAAAEEANESSSAHKRIADESCDADTRREAAVSTPWRVPTIIVTAAVMIMGVLLVAMVGFVPVYVAGFRQVDHAFSALQTQVTSDIIAASFTPVLQLPQFVSLYLSRVVALEQDSTIPFRVTPDEALFTLANAFSVSSLQPFLSVLHLVDTTPGKEWRIMVSNPTGNASLIGAYQSWEESPNHTHVYHIDPATNRLNLSQHHSSVNVSLHEAIFGAKSPYHRLVASGNETQKPSKDPSLEAFWTLFDDGNLLSYINFVAPVRTASGHLAYLESMLSSTSLMQLVSPHLLHALRKNGRYFVVDTKTNLVVANSWNQSLFRYADGSCFAAKLYLHEINDPLAAAAGQQLVRMGYLGPQAATGLKQRMRERAKFRFGRDTASVQTYNYASTHSVGLDIVFVVVTLESDFLSSVYRTRTIMVRAVVVIVAATALLSYWCASYIVRSLNKLIDELQSSKNLQFDSDAVTAAKDGLSMFTELLYVQLAYAQLQQQLIALKPLLPGPLLVPTTEFGESSLGDQNTAAEASGASPRDKTPCVSRHSAGVGSGRHSTAVANCSLLTATGADALGGSCGTAADCLFAANASNSNRPEDSSPIATRQPSNSCSPRLLAANDKSASQNEMVTALIPSNPQGSLNENLRISRKWRQDMRLNTKIFNEQVNVYQRRYCTMLFICRSYTQEVDYGALNRYFSACYAAAAAYNGCLEFLRPDYAVCTFGAHTQMPMHATRATQCALAIYSAIPPDERDKANYVLDSNEFLVGTCGAKRGKKGRVVFDVMHLIGLLRACGELHHRGIIATQSTASRLPDYQSIPIDCVYAETLQSSLVICQVREVTKGTNIALLSQTAKRFREAFHFMTKGSYHKALRVYRKIGLDDPAAARLADMCKRRIRDHSTLGYVTVVPGPRMNLLSRILADTDLAPFLRMQCEYMMQLLGDTMLFRPGRAAPLRLDQGFVEPRDGAAGTMASAGNRGSPQQQQQHGSDDETSQPASRQRSSNAHGGGRHAQHDTVAIDRVMQRAKKVAFFLRKAPRHEDAAIPHESLSTRMLTSLEDATATSITGDLHTEEDEEEEEEANRGNAKEDESHGGNSAGTAPTHGTDHHLLGDDGDDDDGALFEWIKVGSASSSQVAPVPGGAAASSSSSMSSQCDGEGSLIFVDGNGRRWSRSLKAIGDGAFSVVYLGMSEDGVQVAIKCIPRRRRDIDEVSVRGEMQMMAELRHPNIVQYIGFCTSRTHFSIIMEYVPGGSLFAFTHDFGKLDVTIARRFMMDVLSGLSYLHARNTVHCDVKPHNMLIGMDGICKLSDFGSTISEATDCAKSDTELSLRGTAVYMAPEVARGQRCTPQSDIYSLGISLLAMLLGRLPWRWSPTASPNTTQIPLSTYFRSDTRFVQLLSRGDVVPHIPETMGREVHSFCQACCETDPSKRPTAKELLSFPFIL